MSEYTCPKSGCDYSTSSVNGMSIHISVNDCHDMQFPTKEMLVRDINNMAKNLGRTPKTKDLKEHSKFSKTLYLNSFGRWNNALKEAGFDVNIHRKITEEDMKDEILRLADDLGRAPKFCEMAEDGKYSPHLYNKRMGTYRKAIKLVGLKPPSVPTGKDSPHWAGGSTKFYKTDAGLAWRKAVFQRDEYTCQDCGDNTGGNLNAHHVKRRDTHPDIELMIWNGITLCESCHAERHKDEDVYEMMKTKALSSDSDNS